MNCLAGGAVPYDRRFALVRDPYGEDGKAAADRAFDHGAGDVDGGLPDGLGIMFNPSSSGKICGNSADCWARMMPVSSNRMARGGGSLVDGNDGAKLGHDISGSCPSFSSSSRRGGGGWVSDTVSHS